MYDPFYEVSLRFKSGNRLPVASVRITGEEWMAIKAENKELREAAEAVVESARQWSSPSYPTFDRVSVDALDGLVKALEPEGEQ